MIWVAELALIVLSVAMAAWHAHLIKQQRPIYHGLWSLVYLAGVAGATWWICPVSSVSKVILFIFAQGCSHLAVFNISLNWFRGLPWTYTSPTSGSILDKIEIKLFGTRGWLPEVIMIGVFIVLQFFLL